MKKYKVKALVANLGSLQNKVDEVIEIELDEKAYEKLIEKKYIEGTKPQRKPAPKKDEEGDN